MGILGIKNVFGDGGGRDFFGVGSGGEKGGVVF